MAVLNAMSEIIQIFFTQWIRCALRWIVGLGLLTLGAGLIIFPIIIGQTRIQSWKKTDAIVIFTGEMAREKTAIALYHLGLAPKLHISGRYLGFRRGKSPFITFDTAETTEKNVTLSYAWLMNNRIRSVRLVTSDYHMPRCLIWAHQYWSHIEIVPHPIAIPHYKGTRFIIVMLAEYVRYVYALMRIGCAMVSKFF